MCPDAYVTCDTKSATRGRQNSSTSFPPIRQQESLLQVTFRSTLTCQFSALQPKFRILLKETSHCRRWPLWYLAVLLSDPKSGGKTFVCPLDVTTGYERSNGSTCRYLVSVWMTTAWSILVATLPGPLLVSRTRAPFLLEATCPWAR